MSPGTPIPAEAGWAERIRAGDTAAFEALFHAYYESLCAVVEGYVYSRDTAEELVQALFVGLWENRTRWMIREDLRSYLYTAARNRALDYLKHRRVQRRTEDHAAEWAGSPPWMGERPASADDHVVADELDRAVRHAIQQLPDRYRRVFELRTQHHLTYPEIARILDLPVKTTETQGSRALKAVRSAVMKYLS